MVLELVLELRGGGTGADALTTRESQVLGMLRRGHKTSEIADRLAIAPVTVRRHISQLVRKMGVENRAALTRRASACSGRARRGNAACRKRERSGATRLIAAADPTGHHVLIRSSA